MKIIIPEKFTRISKNNFEFIADPYARAQFKELLAKEFKKNEPIEFVFNINGSYGMGKRKSLKIDEQFLFFYLLKIENIPSTSIILNF